MRPVSPDHSDDPPVTLTLLRSDDRQFLNDYVSSFPLKWVRHTIIKDADTLEIT